MYEPLNSIVVEISKERTQKRVLRISFFNFRMRILLLTRRSVLVSKQDSRRRTKLNCQLVSSELSEVLFHTFLNNTTPLSCLHDIPGITFTHAWVVSLQEKSQPCNELTHHHILKTSRSRYSYQFKFPEQFIIIFKSSPRGDLRNHTTSD